MLVDIHIYIYTYIHMYVHNRHTYMHIYIYIYIYIYTHFMYTCNIGNMYVCIYLCLYLFVDFLAILLLASPSPKQASDKGSRWAFRMTQVQGKDSRAKIESKLCSVKLCSVFNAWKAAS